jgi:chromosome segregation ATPase
MHSKEESRQANLQPEASASSETGQILHLKRLLVTLKQHYEKNLQAEQNQRLALQKELEGVRAQWAMHQKLHDEELQALRDQQTALKELLKKAQDELKQFREQADPNSPDVVPSRQRVEQLERVIPYLRDRTEEAHLEAEQLREDLERAQKKIQILEQQLLENKQQSEKEIERFQQLLAAQQEDQLETVFSSNSSHHLRQELEGIKRHLAQGSEEIKALEARYIEILNEKIGLEHHCKQLQMQLEHQSSNLTAFQSHLHEIEDHKKALEADLQLKEKEWQEICQQREALQKRVEDLEKKVQASDFVQDKYEQLKDEWKLLGERLEEAVEGRAQAEQHLAHLEMIAKNQGIQLQELAEQLQLLHQEKQTLEVERDQVKTLLEECETRLKIAQQHLAKKVKEAALLSEKVEEQQGNLADLLQTVEHQKTQIAQLQASVDIYQRQEKRLQEQLHDALKGSESQVSKWEEKYFRMYDKWQESENKIRELKKFEEKHLQMQSLLANLGNFMGGSFNHQFAGQESTERSTRPLSFDSALPETPSVSKTDSFEEKYDLFGMRQPQDKYKPDLFS